MDASTCSLRGTQTRSLAEFLRELQCSLLLAEGRGGHLAVLGADGDGLIRHQSLLPGAEAVAGQGETVAAWGRRRLEILSRGRLLDGRGSGILHRLLVFGTSKSSLGPDHLVALQWGRAGLWGVEPAGYGLLDRAGRYKNLPDRCLAAKAGIALSGLATADGRPAFLSGHGPEAGQGCIMDAASGEVVLRELVSPSSPLLIDATLYFLEGPAGRVTCCDLQGCGRTTVVGLPGPANGMIRFGEHLLISLAGPGAGLSCLHLGSGRLTLLHGRPAERPVRLLDVIASTPRRSRPMAAAVKAASVALAAGMALAQAPSPARAAEVVFTEVKPNIPLYDAVFTSHLLKPTFVDIDGDGDFDLFVGEYSGTVKYFMNTGTANAPVLVEQIGPANPIGGVDVGRASTPTFADIDGDGDLDAFVGEYYGTVKYFKNTGTQAAPVFTEQTGADNPLNGVDTGYYSTPTFADIDGDGDFDAFIGEEYGTVNYFKNTGTQATPVFTEQTGPANPLNGVDVGNYSAPTFVDIDGDGDFDAFIGEYSGTVNYFKNTGTTNAPTLVQQTGTDNPLSGVQLMDESAAAFIDLDSDGDQDAVLAGNLLKLTPYKNTGTAGAPVFASWDDPNIPFNGQPAGFFLSRPTFVNIDGDGDLDAFVGEYLNIIHYWENTGNRLSPQLLERTGAANPLDGANLWFLNTPTFADIDGDGDQDAFIGEAYGSVKYFQNIGTRTAPDLVERTDAANPLDGARLEYLSTPTFVDIDGDGDLDLFIGEAYGAVRYFENFGTRTAPLFAEWIGAANPLYNANVANSSAPAFADVDGDGDFDAFIGEKDGTVKYFENTGTRLAPVFVERIGSANPLDGIKAPGFSAPTFADIDGDGDQDLFIGEYTGTIKYLRNDSPLKKFPWAMFLPAITRGGNN